MATSKVPWRVIAEHLRTWKRDAYVPLRIALSAEEQQRHKVAAPSLIAGYVRKDQLEVRLSPSAALRASEQQTNRL